MTTSRRLAIVENKDRAGLALPIGETPEGEIDWESIEAMAAVSGPFTRRVVETTDPTDAEIEAMAEKLWDVWRRTDHGAQFSLLHWENAVRPDWVGTQTGRKMVSDAVAAFRAMARVALEGRGE